MKNRILQGFTFDKGNCKTDLGKVVGRSLDLRM